MLNLNQTSHPSRARHSEAYRRRTSAPPSLTFEGALLLLAELGYSGSSCVQWPLALALRLCYLAEALTLGRFGRDSMALSMMAIPAAVQREVGSGTALTGVGSPACAQ